MFVTFKNNFVLDRELLRETCMFRQVIVIFEDITWLMCKALIH